jgi:hypothetical protein
MKEIDYNMKQYRKETGCNRKYSSGEKKRNALGSTTEKKLTS